VVQSPHNEVFSSNWIYLRDGGFVGISEATKRGVNFQ
jgi:hypothetical protein